MGAEPHAADFTFRPLAVDRPLPALLSQALVAFTVELDNEFERRMSDAGNPGARLSLVVWLNLMRFLAGEGLSVGELAAQALATDEQIKFELGCLERWGFVTLRPEATDSRTVPLSLHRRAARELRDGWGSGRGIRTDWDVRLTTNGSKAAEIWPPLFGELEDRWKTRFGGQEIKDLTKSLQVVSDGLELELPQGLPGAWQEIDARKYAVRTTHGRVGFPLPVLLSQVLLGFRIEFERESPVPLGLCANVIRVLGEKPVRVAEIARLTGISPEMSAIGWRLKPYVTLQTGPAGSRGKVASLTPRGRKAQRDYYRLVGEIEGRWKKKFGESEIDRLRDSLGGLFEKRVKERSAFAEGLVPPRGVVRAGELAPALGRRDVGAAARQRMRDLVIQTKDFMADPSGRLPHYPMWDFNRGFGP